VSLTAPIARLAARLSAFATVVVVVLAGAATAGPGAWWTPVTGTGCAGAATPHAGLVVDFGTVADRDAKPAQVVQTRCVGFSASPESGSQVLIDAGYELSWNDVGLLCSIDGYPSGGCTSGSGGVYEYWSYWHGGTTWTYANTGPDFTRVSSGGVEGWRFVAGKDSSSEDAPRSSAKGPCPTATPTTTAGVATTTAPTDHLSGNLGSRTSPTTARPGSASTVSTAGRATGAPTTATIGGLAASGRATDGSSDPTGTSQLAAAPSTSHRSGSGSPAAVLAVAALVAVVSIGAFVVSRMRSSS